MTRRTGWGAAAIAVIGMASQIALQATLTEEFHKTYPLEAGGRVSLNNVNGAVKITGWDRNEVQVDAVKQASTKEILDEASIVVDSSSGSISIRTRYPESKRRESAKVEYTLKVPRGARLFAIEVVNATVDVSGVSGAVKISSVNGKVTARNLASEARLSTVNGALEASFDRLEGTPSITLSTVNGGIALDLPDKASAEVSAKSVHGRISSDFGETASRRMRPGGSFSGQIGAGPGARIKLNTVNGGIRIMSTADGRRVRHV